MIRTITQRELRNDSDAIIRQLDRGVSFIVTRNGRPVGELTPLRSRRFVSAEEAVDVVRSAPPIDAARFRADVDALTDPYSEPLPGTARQ